MLCKQMTRYLFWKPHLLQLAIPAAAFAFIVCLFLKKPKQPRPELLTSLANVINHVVGTRVLLDKSRNICHAFCNFLWIPHTLFSPSSPLAGEIYVWTRSDARELVTCHSSTGQYALREIGVAVSWGLVGIPGANSQWLMKRFTREPPRFGGH